MDADDGAAAADPARTCERWRSSLKTISSVFGRLVYLSSLRDRATGHYAHYGLELLCGSPLAVLTIRETHLQTFRDWLRLDLSGKKADLDNYFSGLDAWTRLILAAWAQQKSFRHLIPPDTDGVDRQLFLADIEAVTTLLRTELGAESELSSDSIRAADLWIRPETA